MSRTITPPERAPLNEIARWYGLNYAHLFRAVRTGQLPHENHGTDLRPRYWIKTADMDAYLDELAS